MCIQINTLFAAALSAECLCGGDIQREFVCLHLSAPYIFWVGCIAVREELGGLVI